MQLPMIRKGKIYLTINSNEIRVHIPYQRLLKLVEPRVARKSDVVNLFELTKREREVFDGMRRGLRNKEIGAELNISERTVKSHCSGVFKKTRITSRIELARQYGT